LLFLQLYVIDNLTEFSFTWWSL